MVEVGQFSQADLAQLSAQRASDEYNVVAQESNLRDYTRQLKQILQLTDDGEDFEVSIPDDVTGDALAEIPGLQTVYTMRSPPVPNSASSASPSRVANSVCGWPRLAASRPSPCRVASPPMSRR